MENNGLSFDQPLSGDEQRNLRSRGVIQESEVAVRVGDLLVATINEASFERKIRVRVNDEDLYETSCVCHFCFLL